MKDISEYSVAYWAGFIDGEGCFTLQPQVNDTYLSVFTIGNTNRNIMNMLGDIVGGKARETVNKNPNAKPLFILKLTGEKLKAFYKAISRYLIVKQEVARLVMSIPTLRGSGLSREETIEKQREIKEQVRVLNHRGL